MKIKFKRLYAAIAALVGAVTLLATSPSPAISARIIDNRDTVQLHGNVHPFAQPQFDKGETEPSLRMDRMILTLGMSQDKQAELEALLAQQQDPTSPNFHQWLTPSEFGVRFGPSPSDVAVITGWLKSNNFTVDEIAKGGLWINFSGTVADIKRAFHTQIHNYYVDGKLHHANDANPSIPRGLSDLVAGVVSMHDFQRKAMNTGPKPAPTYTDGSGHYLSPNDFAIIYNLNSLYSAGIDGSGQSIAIVGRTNPSFASADWAAFRGTMGLPANPPLIYVNGPDPGDQGIGEDLEASLDVEWAGAVAKNASILFVASATTYTTDGVDLSAQYVVDNDLAPVMSLSFGACEAVIGTAGNTFYKNLWQQAASQGISVFVSSGDAGAAGCNYGDDTSGSQPGVNGLASTPYNIAVGGTQFKEGTGSYWNSNNGPGDASVKSYIPEIAWNESGAVSGGSGLWASGGGVSTIYTKPAWQVAPGVPSGSYRYVPDVSLTAASHDAYLVEVQGSLYTVGGTSAASPSFAGLMALIVQKTGQRQGNANPLFYKTGNAQYGYGGPTVFHNIISGNNSVPGVTGYTCSADYSPVTGLGSVDANALIDNVNLQMQSFTFAVTKTGSGSGIVTSSPAGIVCGSTCSASFSGVTGVTLSASPDSNYYFTGWSGACSGTQPACLVTVTGATSVTAGFAPISAPGAPTGVSAIPGNAQATVSFTAPSSNGGSPITSYTVTSNPGNITASGTASPINVTGLTNGTAYTFTVTAINAYGYGAASAPSAGVTPSQSPAAPVPALSVSGLLTAMGGLASILGFRRKRDKLNAAENL